MKQRIKVAAALVHDPTVLLLDASGREVARVAEFVPPARMLQLMRGVQ